jgi:hypothetical protein
MQLMDVMWDTFWCRGAEVHWQRCILTIMVAMHAAVTVVLMNSTSGQVSTLTVTEATT